MHSESKPSLLLRVSIGPLICFGNSHVVSYDHRIYVNIYIYIYIFIIVIPGIWYDIVVDKMSG